MQQYHDFLNHIRDHGIQKQNRTGVETISTFGYQMRFDLSQGFPLVTTKKCFIDGIIHELLWFLSGNTNIKYLTDNNVKIWNAWADDNGDLGPVYGEMWRSWPAPTDRKPEKTIDQISDVIDLIKTDPDSRRLIVSAWNPSVLPDPSIDPKDNVQYGKAALPPCHTLFQFYVAHGKLSCQLYQRSADAFLGVPFNIASYALLTMMIAQVCDLDVGDFVHTFGDAHIYTNHEDQVLTQLHRRPRELPTMVIDKSITNIFDFKREHFELLNYDPHPSLRGKIAV